MDLDNTLLNSNEKDEHRIILNDISLYNHTIQKPSTTNFKLKKNTKTDNAIKEKCDSFYDEFLLNAELLKKQLDSTVENLKLTIK